MGSHTGVGVGVSVGENEDEKGIEGVMNCEVATLEATVDDAREGIGVATVLIEIDVAGGIVGVGRICVEVGTATKELVGNSILGVLMIAKILVLASNAAVDCVTFSTGVLLSTTTDSV